MLKKGLIATLLVATSLPAWSLDIKSGHWEMTRVMQGNLPPELTQELAYEECMTQSEIDDLEGTFRESMTDGGFHNLVFSHGENTLNVTAVNTTSTPNISMDVTMTRYSDEHFKTITEATSQEPFTIIQEGHWVREGC
ncbi:DUF3617 domain-containing protein [Vreelandella venusta]|uniref:DUF3617 domain-containing protein n=1 Tax=Vreelandella venusta TaxID=44935 RepID=UPI0018DA4365|nr:DUF3617 family protein [Halomonas venusta]QPI65975.1 DUF3617 family protein [Halomonas venusta]